MARAKLQRPKQPASKKKATVVKKPRAMKNPLLLSNCKWHGDNVPFYSNKHGMKTSCVDCSRKRCAAYDASHVDWYKARAMLPKETVCEKHPTCSWWNNAGDNCGWCDSESNIISNATKRDKKRGLACTMTRDYIDEYIGSNCTLCNFGPLVPQKAAWHPRQLSMNRVDNSKPHDCDPAQTQPTCLQCNLGMWIHTKDEFFVYLDGIVNGMGETVESDVVTALEDEAWMHEKLIQKKNSRKKNCDGSRRKPEDVVPFTLTYSDAVAQLRVQNHCCSLCHLALSVKNCSFDQTNAKGGYIANNFTFMHRCCNLFKCEWDIEIAIETAHRAVAFRNSKTDQRWNNGRH
jgi:hypothetical protein